MKIINDLLILCGFALVAFLIACSGSDAVIADPDVLREDSIAQSIVDADSIDWYISSKGIDPADVRETDTGIKYYITDPGNGEIPEFRSIISVDYICKFINDSIFDTTIENIALISNIWVDGRTYDELRFNLTNSPNMVTSFISGFNEGLSEVMLMEDENANRIFSKGAKATILVPSAQAYGTTGTVDRFGFPTGAVGPNEVLVYEFIFVNFRP